MAQVGDIGSILRFNAGESITDQTLLQLKYKKPDGTTGTWTATVYDSNYAQYTTLTVADLDVSGVWEIQIYIESAAWKGHSEIDTFVVERNAA